MLTRNRFIFRRPGGAAVAAGVIASLALAACGSSSSSSSQTAPPAAASTSSAAGATTSADSSSGGGSSTLLQTARTAYPTAYEGPTAPAKAPHNVTLAVITCSSQLSGCVSPAVGVQAAARTLGWSVHVYDGGGTPQKQNAAMLDAISAGANVIANIAIDPNLVQQGLQAAQKAKVLVVSGSDGIDTPNPVETPGPGKLGYKFDVGPDYAALGRKAADWIIGDSGGKADVAVFSDKEFPSVIAFQNGLLAGLKTCSGCTISPLQEFNGTQVGTTLGNQTTGFLQSNPSVNYVFSPYDPAAAAQVTAIATAGMAHRVKLVGVLGSQQNINFIRHGQVQAADAAYDNRYMGYMIVDSIIRTLDKKPLFSPHGGNLPFVVLDRSNLPAAGSDWTASSLGYEAKFEALWK